MNAWEWLTVLAGIGAFAVGGIALAVASSVDSPAWRAVGGVAALCGVVAFFGALAWHMVRSRTAARH